MNMMCFSKAARVAPRFAALAIAAGIGLQMPAAVFAAVAPADKCESTKAKTAGKYAKCLGNEDAKAIKKQIAADGEKLLKCEDKFFSAFNKAEDKADGACPTTDDVLAVGSTVGSCVDDVVTALGGVPGPGGDEAKCQSSKVKEAVKYADCRFKALAKAITKNLAPDFTKCEEKLLKKWTKLEEKPCSTTGDHGAVKADVDACYGDVASAIDGIPDPVVSYSEDFESLDPNNPTALGDTGWKLFVNVFNPDTSYAFGYGVFPAPNGNNISAVATGQGGAEQGSNQLSVFSDYSCCDLATPNPIGHDSGQLIETNVFQERTLVAGDSGQTLTFAFDAKRGNINDPSGNTTALAFIKILKQSDFSYATLAFPTTDMTAVPATWGGFTVTVDVTPDMVGELLQIGFSSTATDFDPAGIFYDNIVVSSLPTP